VVDSLPAEVSALVVRLEPRAAALPEPGRRLPGAAERSVPVDRRAPVRAAGAAIPGCEAGSQSLVAARQVAARDPGLSRAGLPLASGALRDRLRVVRDSFHGSLSARAVRVRCRGRPLDQ